MRQAVQLLDYAVRAGMPDYSHAFQPLLRPLDDFAVRILEKRLKPHIRADPGQSRDYFSPYLDDLPPKERARGPHEVMNGIDGRIDIAFLFPLQRIGIAPERR